MKILTSENIEKARENGRIDIIKLANNVGVKVRPLGGLEETFSSTNAYITHERDGNFVIYVNPNQSKQRQRFSIAHELAHYNFHQDEIKKNKKVDRDSVNSLEKEKERKADEYAAELLMPEIDLRSYIDENNLNGQKVLEKKSVEEMAKRYDVSLYAMILRLRELGFYVPYIDVYA